MRSGEPQSADWHVSPVPGSAAAQARRARPTAEKLAARHDLRGFVQAYCGRDGTRSWSPDGATIAVAGADNQVLLVSAEDDGLTLQARSNTLGGWISALHWNHDGRMIARPWRPAPVPSSRELFTDNAKRRLAALGQALSACARPAAGLRRAWRLWPWVKEIFGQRPAPRTSFNRPLGPDRTFAVIRGSLETVKKTAHAHDATVNDVLMAAIAGGLRDLMRSRGERVEGVVLRTVVPVSLHGKSGQAQGNSDGAMFVSLPIGVPDPIRRLELIAAQTSERKKHDHPPGGMLLRNGFVQRVFMRHMARQRWVNVYVANLPGPKTQLHLAGAPLVELFPWYRSPET